MPPARHLCTIVVLLLIVRQASGSYQKPAPNADERKEFRTRTATNRKTMQVFGILVYTYKDQNGQPKNVPYCEGVLLGERYVLTSAECLPAKALSDNLIPRAPDPSSSTFSFRHRGAENPFQQTNSRLTVDEDLAIIYLSHPVRLPPAYYAFPSWDGNVQSSDNKWNIRAEEVADNPVRLSSWYAADESSSRASSLQSALSSCEFVKRVDLIALECSSKTGETLVNNGAAFFKLTTTASTRSVAVLGIVNLETSGTSCRDAPSTVTPGVCSGVSGSSKGYLCGKRLDQNTVRDILFTMSEVSGSHISSDSDVIPSQTIVGTMNLNGLARYARDMNERLAESVVKILTKPSIMAMQEVPALEGTSAAVKLFKSEKILEHPDVSMTHTDVMNNLVFLYKEAEVKLTGKCEPIKTFGQLCLFKFKRAVECFAMINVHLTYGKPTKRNAEIKSLRTFIDAYQAPSGCSKVVLCLGDFNTGGGTGAPDEITDAEFLLKNLNNMRFHDPGPTTPKVGGKSHYDRILVSENLRLMHYYWPSRGISTQSDRIRYYLNNYIPVMPESLRKLSPGFRNVDLSDHLPVIYKLDRKTAIGTWNVERFDVTVPDNPKLDQKEVVHKDKFETIFNFFNVLAVQELSSAFDGSKFNDDITKPYLVSGPKLFGKTWLISRDVRELGFAYDEGVLDLVSCRKLDMSGHTFKTDKGDKPYRDGFGCTFRRKDDNTKFSLVSVHVLNAKSTLTVAREYIAEAELTYPPYGRGSTAAFVVGDFNVGEPYFDEILQSSRCQHERGSHSSWHFTMLNSKNVRDYIWRVGNKTPGQTGCRVINPELHKGSSTFTFPSTRQRMKAFSSWKEISDHYPVYAQFYDPTQIDD